MWTNERFIKLSGIELPIIQAPMAGLAFSDMGRSRFACVCATERGTSTQGT